MVTYNGQRVVLDGHRAEGLQGAQVQLVVVLVLGIALIVVLGGLRAQLYLLGILVLQPPSLRVDDLVRLLFSQAHRELLSLF